ncbi:MAG: hypothetical protein KCHDKBKB_01507 [Elusimicrobia bacterium]|nr:hypothetical protein [Elusimicrobiota bacterium]
MSDKLFKAGEVICREGELGGTLYLIVSGQVLVEKKAFEGEMKTKTVARLGAGEFFGEMAFLQGLPHSATVTAAEDTTLLPLSRATLDELIRTRPSAAIEEVMNVSMGLSNRLRATTRELVTVYEVARAVANAATVEELAKRVVGQLKLDLGEHRSVAFYRWNMFNDEYTKLVVEGTLSAQFPDVLDPSLQTLPWKKEKCLISSVDMLQQKQGLFVTLSEKNQFDAGERQMMETVSSVMAPALATAQHREEEESRRLLERNKQMGASL